MRPESAGLSRWGGRISLCVSLALGVAACTSLRDDLKRAESAYADARYEDAQQWVDALSRDVATLDPSLRAKYFFVAGMTHLRLGDEARARHELALCAAQVEIAPNSLSAPVMTLLRHSLLGLNRPYN